MSVESIGVIGYGSIGSVLARGFEEIGHDIHIWDVDRSVRESAPYPAQRPAWLGDRMDLVVIAVPTPTTDTGPDVSAVDDVLAQLGTPSATVCIRSTMPPGTTGRLADRYGIPVVYSPEFLRDRSDVSDFFDPDRIVLAGPESERQTVRGVFEDSGVCCSQYIETADYLTAEIGKEAHNAIFATKVSFANQVRMIAEAGGADPETTMSIVTADHRTSASHMDPMLGPFGGQCLPKDTRALAYYAREVGVPDTLLFGALDINCEAKRAYTEKQITGEWPDIEVVAADGDGS